MCLGAWTSEDPRLPSLASSQAESLVEVGPFVYYDASFLNDTLVTWLVQGLRCGLQPTLLCKVAAYGVHTMYTVLYWLSSHTPHIFPKIFTCQALRSTRIIQLRRFQSTLSLPTPCLVPCSTMWLLSPSPNGWQILESWPRIECVAELASTIPRGLLDRYGYGMWAQDGEARGAIHHQQSPRSNCQEGYILQLFHLNNNHNCSVQLVNLSVNCVHLRTPWWCCATLVLALAAAPLL